MFIPMERTYEYLGIQLYKERNYLAEQDKLWEEKSMKVLRQMYAKSL